MRVTFHQFVHRMTHISRWLALIIMVVIAGTAPVQPAQSNPADQTTIYLPMLASRLEPPVFGVEMRNIAHEKGLGMAISAGTYWVRRNALLWRFVETTEGGQYDWTDVRTQTLEQELISANRSGMQVILIVRSSPRWAVAPYRSDCAPINPDYYDDFARFMAAAVKRYSQPPYNVTYWEIGNEPDAYVFPNNSGYGCWGIEDDPYYGGRAYGEMLKTVVPAMRAANPDIKILNGGLLLDKPYNPETGAYRSARFLEGAFTVGAAPMIDLISYHHYIEYGGSLQDLTNDNDWKVAYLREMMDRYKVPQKPLIKTETALLCRTVTPECQWAQADTVPRLYTRALRDELLGVLWYHYDGDSFHNTGFIETTDDLAMPRPAFFAYRHAVRMLNDARYERQITELPAGAEGYLFTRGLGRKLIVAWANRPTMVTLTVPRNAQVSCTDRDGGALTCGATNGRLVIELDRSPIYISY